MTPTAELRARARAARRLYAYPAAQRRADEAAARLDAALRTAGADALTVPGFRITRTPDGIAVTPQAPTHADQLALWSPTA
jgi:uroporphyrinogen-III synthase